MLNEFLTSGGVWGCALTIAAYGLGWMLNKKTGKAWCNPLLLAVLAVIAFLAAADIPYENYKASAAPISYLLMPATVCLAVPLYEKWDLLTANAVPILAGILTGVAASLGSVLAMALTLGLSPAEYVTLLPKSVTTAIGMDIATELGGMPALASAVIILTGIVGNLIAEPVCRLFRIKNPVARGIAIGTASHAIGTARALELGETEGAMSSLSIAVAGLMTVAVAQFFAGLV